MSDSTSHKKPALKFVAGSKYPNRSPHLLDGIIDFLTLWQMPRKCVNPFPFYNKISLKTAFVIAESILLDQV